MLPSSEHTIGPFFPQTFFREGDNDLRRITADAAPSLAAAVQAHLGVPAC